MVKDIEEGKYLYNLLSWIVGINLLKFFGRSSVYDFLSLIIVIYIFYKSIRHIVKYKKYKHPVIVMILGILLNLIFAVIRVFFNSVL